MALTLVRSNDPVSAVAHEIGEGARRYDGSRWEVFDSVDHAIRFPVFSKSLQGKRPDELRASSMPFKTQLQLVEKYSYQSATGYKRSVKLLSNYHFELEVDEGVFTGKVWVWERADDYAL